MRFQVNQRWLALESQPLSVINHVLKRLGHGDVSSRVVRGFSDNTW